MRNFTIEKTDSQCIVIWQYYSSEVFVGFIILAVLTGIVALFSPLSLWGLTLFFIALAVHTRSGKIKNVLDADGFTSTYTNHIRKREKRFDLADIRLFEKQIRYSHGKLSSGQYTYLLRVVCLNDRSSESFGLPSKEYLEEELDDLCDQLNIFLGTLKAEVAGIPANWEVPEPIVFALDSSPQQIEPPPKSKWHYLADFNSVGFQKRGENKIQDFIKSLIVAIFVNGIVLFFALLLFGLLHDEQPMKGETLWGMLICLSPFILYGLIKIGAVLYHFFEWFRITTWMFAYGEAEFRTVRFGWQRTLHYKLTNWDSLVVCLPEDEKVSPVLIAAGNPETIREFYDACDLWQLAFLDSAGEALMSIDSLSKPEALWMVDVVLREQQAIR
jgi:hypothetical protein